MSSITDIFEAREDGCYVAQNWTENSLEWRRLACQSTTGKLFSVQHTDKICSHLYTIFNLSQCRNMACFGQFEIVAFEVHFVLIYYRNGHNNLSCFGLLLEHIWKQNVVQMRCCQPSCESRMMIEKDRLRDPATGIILSWWLSIISQ